MKALVDRRVVKPDGFELAARAIAFLSQEQMKLRQPKV